MPVLFFGLLIGLGALLTGHAAVRFAALTVPGLRSRPSLSSVWVVLTSAFVIKNVLASPLTTWAADQGNLDALGAAFFWARPVPAALGSLAGYALAGAVMSMAVIATLARLRTFNDERRKNEPIEWLDLLSLLILMVLWAAAIVTHVLITGNGPLVAAFTVAVTSAMMWLLVIYETRRFVRDIARRAGDAEPPAKPKGVRRFALLFAWLVLCSIAVEVIIQRRRELVDSCRQCNPICERSSTVLADPQPSPLSRGRSRRAERRRRRRRAGQIRKKRSESAGSCGTGPTRRSGSSDESRSHSRSARSGRMATSSRSRFLEC